MRSLIAVPPTKNQSQVCMKVEQVSKFIDCVSYSPRRGRCFGIDTRTRFLASLTMTQRSRCLLAASLGRAGWPQLLRSPLILPTPVTPAQPIPLHCRRTSSILAHGRLDVEHKLVRSWRRPRLPCRLVIRPLWCTLTNTWWACH